MSSDSEEKSFSSDEKEKKTASKMNHNSTRYAHYDDFILQNQLDRDLRMILEDDNVEPWMNLSGRKLSGANDNWSFTEKEEDNFNEKEIKTNGGETPDLIGDSIFNNDRDNAAPFTWKDEVQFNNRLGSGDLPFVDISSQKNDFDLPDGEASFTGGESYDDYDDISGGNTSPKSGDGPHKRKLCMEDLIISGNYERVEVKMGELRILGSSDKMYSNSNDQGGLEPMMMSDCEIQAQLWLNFTRKHISFCAEINYEIISTSLTEQITINQKKKRTDQLKVKLKKFCVLGTDLDDGTELVKKQGIDAKKFSQCVEEYKSGVKELNNVKKNHLSHFIRLCLRSLATEENKRFFLDEDQEQI